MPIKKSELYSSLWQSCDELRGGMDASQYKDYVLVLLFVKYVSDKAASQKGYLLDVPKGGSFGHPEFTAFNESISALFAKWRKASTSRLKSIAIGDKPKALIESLSEDLLDTFRKARLLDAYDVYQHLLDYWVETMQDDVYMLVSDGWREAAKPRLIIEDKDKKTKEKPDFTVGRQKFKAGLIPAPLLVARYFAKEQAAIERLEAEVAALADQLGEMAEEQGGEGGLLEDVVECEGDKKKIAAKAVKARLKEVGKDPDFADERQALEDYVALLDKQSDAKSRLETAQDALETKVAAKYGKLTEDEIKALVGTTNGWPRSRTPCSPNLTGSRRRSRAASGNWPTGTPLRCRNSPRK